MPDEPQRSVVTTAVRRAASAVAWYSGLTLSIRIH
jgi:hypothetical protein